MVAIGDELNIKCESRNNAIDGIRKDIKVSTQIYILFISKTMNKSNELQRNFTNHTVLLTG